MDKIFVTGLIGGLILVLGSAWPEKKVSHPTKSTKNWLLAIGSLIMFIFSLLGYYLQNAPIFFVLLEGLVIIASVMMMIDVNDKIDTAVLGLGGMIFVGWSLYLFEGYNTVFFIIGLTAIGLGYAFKQRTFKRTFALFLGSLLIAIFSFIEKSFVFFWLNTFFALFSFYYLIKR